MTINPQKAQKAFVLVLIVFVTYFPSVFYNFMGDDHLLIEKNTFYSSWSNIHRLFEQGNIHQTRDFFSNNHDYGTGCVSYRPVLSLTYFLDYHVWGNKPYGYHLTNIIIHCLNCVLFYMVLSCIFGLTLEGFFAALLFGLHPIQSEAVVVIGYRADILASFFVLCSLFSWIKFRSSNQVGYYALSLIMYFLALFSKESSIMLPVLLFFYDRIFVPPQNLKQKGVYYAGFVPVLVFYLYVYIFVFPNSSLSLLWLGGSVGNHFLTIFNILYLYFKNFLAPWTITLLPGEYYPPTPGIFEAFKMALVFTILAGLLIKFYRGYKQGVFFILWFTVFYLPVSNLLPIANPMAYRFMYLPSAGLLTIFALVLYRTIDSPFLKRFSSRLFSVLYIAVILIVVTCTLFTNSRLKSDFDAGYAMVQYYPYSATGYVLLGEQYYMKGAFARAKDYFEKAVQYGYNDPQIDMQLGICYFELGDFKKAKKHLLEVTTANPDFKFPRILLDRIDHM